MPTTPGWRPGRPRNTAAAGFPTHHDPSRPDHVTPRTALAWWPTPTGWVDTAPPPEQAPAYREYGVHPGLVADFATRPGAFLAALYCPEWRLGRVGLCFARHARVVTWDLGELAGLLAGTPTVGAFDRERAGFERVFRETMTAHGLQLS